MIKSWLLLFAVTDGFGLPTRSPLQPLQIPNLNEFFQSLSPAFIFLNSATPRFTFRSSVPVAYTTYNLSYILDKRIEFPFGKLVQIMIVVTQVPEIKIHYFWKVSKYMSTLIVFTYHSSIQTDPSKTFELYGEYEKQYLVHFEQVSADLKPHSGWYRFTGLVSTFWMKPCTHNAKIAHCIQQLNDLVHLNVRKNISNVLLTMLADNNIKYQGLGYG